MNPNQVPPPLQAPHHNLMQLMPSPYVHHVSVPSANLVRASPNPYRRTLTLALTLTLSLTPTPTLTR
jgi:hypothetical protein